MKLAFLGAAGTVTGSRYLIEHEGYRLLVDCGLFQGLKRLRLMNRDPFPVDPASLDAVLLTHAHLDHSGYLPRLVADGFRGAIYCTPPTRDLSRILLLDSASLMEEEARHALRHGWSKHAHPRPLYTTDDALRCLPQFQSVEMGKEFRLTPGVAFRFRGAGHILGAAQIEVHLGGTRLLFSGDLGRPRDSMLFAPEPPPACDYLAVESTYGDRAHGDVDPGQALAAEINRTAGVVLIPSFAVGRTQAILLQLWALKRCKAIPDLPVFVDSPMAADVTHLYRKYARAHKLGSQQCAQVFGAAHYVRTPDESKALSARKGSMIIISASGMATGGRVLHHLKAFAPHPENAVLLAGFQAEGTRGAQLAQGAERVKIHGEYVPVKARTAMLPNISAHADANEILSWLRACPTRPRRVFATHGEPVASATLCDRIRRELGWDCVAPKLGAEIELQSIPWTQPLDASASATHATLNQEVP